MHRIYFDTNEGIEDGDGAYAYGLWLDSSKEDLARIPDGPKEGMRVIIYMTGELEMEALLAFSPTLGDWLAHPLLQTIKHYY